MINRNRTQTQYVFNSETGMLEKNENIATLAKAAEEQKQKQAEPVTSIMVVTAEDNLIHNYFYSYETSWDASNCLQLAIIKMPKMGQTNINYWATYTGQLTIYMGYNFTYDNVNETTHLTEQEAVQSVVRYWDNSNVKPFFRGEVDKIKEYKNDITIYVKNIGARFQQKIPEDFRQAYIYNQPVRDSFQAICEFLGVQYICPPQIVTDEAGEETTNGETENDGTENDVSNQVATSNALVNRAKTKALSNNNTNSKFKNRGQSQLSALNNGSESNENEDENNTEENNTEEGMEVEVNDIMNGYDDISFDANGAITHSSAIIETSPDIAHTLIAMEENPLERYLDDETGIIEKVQKFLNGDMFEEIHNNVMDYGAITIQPKSSTSSEISSETSGDSTMDSNGDGTISEEEAKRFGQNLLNKGRTGITLSGVTFTKTALSYEDVNKMTAKQARQEMAKTDKYYYTTIVRLRARAAWGRPIGPNTDYSKYYY